MLSRATRRALNGALDLSSSQSLAAPSLQPSRCFSVCPRCLSKIGRAPIPIPPGVTLAITPSAQATGLTGGAIQSDAKRLTASQRKRLQIEKVQRATMSTVQIEGPLGKFSMLVPPFVSFEQSETENNQGRVVIGVQDATMRKQREMWGECYASLSSTRTLAG